MSIFVNKELRDLIPPLSEEEFEQLEKNVVAEGIRDPLVVWRQPDGHDMLIDGHNRFFISAHHAGIPFKTVNMDFADMNEAKLWIIDNQLGKRNLIPYDKTVLLLKRKEILSKIARQISNSNLKQGIAERPKLGSRGRVNKQIGDIVGMGAENVRKVEVIQNSGDQKLIDDVRSGETTINRAYQTIKGNEPQNKSMREMKQERLEQAKQEHEEFKSQKVVSMQDIAKNKDNKRLIAKTLYSELLGIGKRIEDVSIRSKEKDIDINGMSAMLTHEERKLLLDMIGVWRTQLMQIAQEVIRD